MIDIGVDAITFVGSAIISGGHLAQCKIDPDLHADMPKPPKNPVAEAAMNSCPTKAEDSNVPDQRPADQQGQAQGTGRELQGQQQNDQEPADAQSPMHGSNQLPPESVLPGFQGLGHTRSWEEPYALKRVKYVCEPKIRNFRGPFWGGGLGWLGPPERGPNQTPTKPPGTQWPCTLNMPKEKGLEWDYVTVPESEDDAEGESNAEHQECHRLGVAVQQPAPAQAQPGPAAAGEGSALDGGGGGGGGGDGAGGVQQRGG
eukprot:1143581-Pelagomonas_calceolata.AAC.1